ncbi:MAG: enolase C-terminal domain-like protein [Myxococcota bacterium]
MVVLKRAHTQPYRLPSGPPTDGTRHGGWLWLEDEHGRRGLGEYATWPGFAPPLETLQEWAERACTLAVDRELSSLERLVPPELSDAPSPVRYAWESAALDLVGQAAERPIADLLRPDAEASVAINALVSGTDDAVRAVAEGFTTLKIKLKTLDDLTRVRAVRQAVPASTRIRLDPGGRLTLDEAHALLLALRELDIEYVEDPIAATDAEAWLALSKHGVALAVDQKASAVEWTHTLLATGAADTLVLKPMFDGGLLATSTRAEQWQARGGRVVLTSALESPVGVAAAVHLACALRLPSACGLTTPVRVEGPTLHGGRLAHARAPGLGARPTP